MMFLKKSKRTKSRQQWHHSKTDPIEDINKARAQVGLPAFKTEMRECLKCSELFKATIGTGNFLCEYCGARVGSEEPWTY